MKPWAKTPRPELFLVRTSLPLALGLAQCWSAKAGYGSRSRGPARLGRVTRIQARTLPWTREPSRVVEI
ncbi:hypothetical protein V6N12_048893 [Hibiscus sabdariffa]|uniref:Secreted protein n=1 Tax=Hibiscus sabdariffa TaxID=183260 RepID=A0ABR2EIL3_9ROSI